MGSDRSSQDVPCVLTLLRQDVSGAALEIPPRWRPVSAPSAYEAAAEILAGNVEVLIVDLSLVGKRHRELLSIARDMGVQVVALGARGEAIPAGGIGPAAWGDVPDLLRQLAETQPQEVEPAPPLEEAPPAPGDYQPVEIPAPSVTLAPAKKAHETRSFDDPSAAGPAVAPPTVPAPPAATNLTPQNLLTADELEALLRDKP